MIDTRVHGEPTACHSLAASLQSYESALDGTIDALTAGRNETDGAWDGVASDMFTTEVTGLRSEVVTLQGRISSFRHQLVDFADSLSVVRSSFASLRTDAAAAGLAVSGESILPPTAPAPDTDDDGTYEDRERWNGVGKWTGRLGVGLTTVTSAVDQWREDGDDPSMGTAERVTRAATQGATTGAGAWAGGLAGAKIGAGLGSLAGPVGTVVGGIVGGTVGGVIGGGAGEWIGDQLVDVAGDVGEVVGDAAEDVGHLFGDAVGDAGDAIRDAWEGLWD